MVKVYAEKDGEKYLIRGMDHATGSEIVCAGVSALVYAFAGYVANTSREHSMRFDSGFAEIVCEGGADVEAVYEAVVIGLKQIELNYPDYIMVMEKEQA